jgi:hypothetical protein
MEKKGQVTIFIIIAIVIVVFGVLIFSFWPQIRAGLGGGIKNPQAFIQECVEEELEEAVELVSLQGGSVEPEYYTLHENLPVEYLCYIHEEYETCSVQQALLKEHIESEIEGEIEEVVMGCLDSLETSYKNRGYDVNLDGETFRVELLPKRVVAILNVELTLTKGDTENYESFDVVLNSNLYEFVGIAKSILEWESVMGNSNPNMYMELYPDLKVELKIMSDDTKIYILTNKNDGKIFKFASRSLVFPSGI